MEIKCPECSYDLTLLFYPEDSMGKMVIKCPDCDTQLKLKEEGSEEIEPFPDKKRKPLPLGKEIEYTESVEVTDSELQAINSLKPKENDYVTKCIKCETEVSLYLSYLVRIQTQVFPKKEERIETLSPAGNIVEEIKTTYLPPMKIKGRLCNDCFNRISITEFSLGNIELLPDPMNMVRDGIRNVKDAPIIRYEKDIIEKEDIGYIPKPGAIKDNDVVLGFGHRDSDTSNYMVFVKDDKKVVERPRRSFPLKPSRINVNLHPSRRVRKVNIPQFPQVEFATNKERRNAFKRWFEHG